jgi:hypothetical protein
MLRCEFSCADVICPVWMVNIYYLSQLWTSPAPTPQEHSTQSLYRAVWQVGILDSVQYVLKGTVSPDYTVNAWK